MNLLKPANEEDKDVRPDFTPSMHMGVFSRIDFFFIRSSSLEFDGKKNP